MMPHSRPDCFVALRAPRNGDYPGVDTKNSAKNSRLIGAVGDDQTGAAALADLHNEGVDVGDVIEESDGDLMGDGVNIAARLEGIAAPGAICLSEQAYWQVKGRLDLAVTGDAPTELRVSSDVAILGRIGELGQPLIARQADKVLAGFADCLRAAVAAR